MMSVGFAPCRVLKLTLWTTVALTSNFTYACWLFIKSVLYIRLAEGDETADKPIFHFRFGPTSSSIDNTVLSFSVTETCFTVYLKPAI
mmetsp:Transcript_10435/g.17061  ORF Transcript_10435/g.17061 Transcript_10435/m.17061 type:complete len:88 (+) Transcript_10435:1507-1770(+)